MKRKTAAIYGAVSVLILIPAVLLILDHFLFAGKREEQRRKTCAAQLVSIGCVLRMYSNVYDEHFPSEDGAKGLDTLRFDGFLENPFIYTCPSAHASPRRGVPLTEQRVSYMYFGGHTESDPPDTIIMCDKPGNHGDFRNILFLDNMVGGYSNGVLRKYDKFKNAYLETDRTIPEKELEKLK